MKKLIIIVFSISSNLFSQPTSNKDINYEINLSIQETHLDKNKNDGSYIIINDTVVLVKKESEYFSTDNIIKIKILNKNYNLLSKKRKWSHILNYNNIKINYTPAFLVANCDSFEFSQKLSDIVLLVEKQGQYMKVIFKLYSGKDRFFNNKMDIIIPFCSGTYEVTDSTNPILIAIKEDEK